MKKSAARSLRSLLTEAAPIRSLPAGVVRQLVGYYGDWRRSRDILNEAGSDAGEPGVHGRPRLHTLSSLSQSSRSYHAQ